MILLLAFLAALQQEPAGRARPTPLPRGPIARPSTDSEPAPAQDERLELEGGIQAPAQPDSKSTSTVTRTPRSTPVVPSRALSNSGTRLDAIVAVRGMEENTVSGIGIVTGLAGTGDSAEAARRLLANLLYTRNIRLDAQQLSSKNLAVVAVEAQIPAGVEPGRRLDATISAIGDSASLQGGILAMCELTDLSGMVVYATASGPVSVGGFAEGGEGASAKKNHTTTATLVQGAKIEREVPTSIVNEQGFVHLDLLPGRDSFANCARVVEAINTLYPQSAEAAFDGKSVRVALPLDLAPSQGAMFLDTVLRREIQSDDRPRVLVNERTGVIVMGGDVRLRPGAIAQGSLTVTIAETPVASQPGPFSGGTTQVLPRTDVNVEEEDNALVAIPSAATLQEVVDVLNVLGTTPRDLIGILQAMSQAGLLEAEIRRM